MLDLLDFAILHQDPDQAALLHEISIDLRGLPAKEPRQFELSIENQEFGNSQWASLRSWDGYTLEFGTGSHIYDPGVGGDTSSETIYECSADGEARGYLSDWLQAIERLDHSNITVAASSDEIEPEEEAEEIEESPEDYRSRVRTDHYAQKFACIAVAVYGWQLHGWVVGLGVYFTIFVVILTSNTVVLNRSSEETMFRNLRISRWGWVILAGIALMVSGASVEYADDIQTLEECG